MLLAGDHGEFDSDDGDGTGANLNGFRRDSPGPSLKENGRARAASETAELLDTHWK